MKNALITGANRSIGFETARQLLQRGFEVYLGSRSLESGERAVEALRSEGFQAIHAVQLDVADEQSVAAARERIGLDTEKLDVLINNAGISGGFPQPAGSAPVSTFQEVFEVNLFGAVRVTQSFLDLLRLADEARIVNVTSGLASLTLHNDPAWKYYGVGGAVYSSSKAALNMYTIALAKELRDTGIKVNAVDPGYTATDFNHHSGPGSVEDAAARIVRYAVIPADGPTGGFFSDDNNPETGISPW